MENLQTMVNHMLILISAVNKFEQETGLNLREDFQGSTITIGPEFRRSDVDKSEAEQYNRAYQYLRCFNRQPRTYGEPGLTSDKRLHAWWSKSDLFKTRDISNIFAPEWMQRTAGQNEMEVSGD